MKTVTLTSKGQLTLPVEIRRALGLKHSEKLQLSFNSETRSITLQRPMTVEEFSDFMMTLPRKKVKPVTNVSEYYNKHREVR